MSREKVTQVLNLLQLDSEIQDFILGLEETDRRLGVVTERRLRVLLKLPKKEQQAKFWKLVQ